MSSSLLTTVKDVLLAKKIHPTPENTVNACLETIIELHDRKRSDFDGFLDLIAQMKVFPLTKTALKVLSLCIKTHTPACCAILKNLFQQGKLETSCESTELFGILLANVQSKGVCNIIAKNFPLSECFSSCSLETYTTLLENSMEILAPTFNITEVIATQGLDSAAITRILQAYLRNRVSGSVDEAVLCTAVEHMSPLAATNLELLVLILGFHKKNVRSARLHGGAEPEPIFSKKLVGIIKSEIFDAHNSDEDLSELVSLLSDSILPTFASLIAEVNEKFIAEKKYQRILQNMISYIKLQDFADIAGAVDIYRHAVVFKGLSNVDLGVLFGLYRFYSAGTELEAPGLDYSRSEPIDCVLSVDKTDALHCLMACLPSFCYYCTDHLDNGANLVKLLKHHINTHPSVVSSAVEKLIHSHCNNVNSLLTLNNPIPREQSTKILSLVKESGIVYDFVNRLVKCDTFECEGALQLLLRLTDIDLSRELITAIQSPQETSTLSLYDALRLMLFFADRHLFDMDFISRLLELCSSQQNQVQKKAYQLLYQIYSLKRTNVCICDMLYSSLVKTMRQPSEGNRIQLLSTILRNGCADCKIENRDEMIDKFVSEVVKGAVLGNVKCRRAARDTVKEMATSQYFLDYFLNCTFRKTDDTDLICGCVMVASILLEHACNSPECYGTHLDKEGLFQRLLSISSHSQRVAKCLIKVFSFIATRPELSAFYGEMAKVVDSYISQFSKKMNGELKEFCINAQKLNLPLSKGMRTLLRFRNKGGKGTDVVIVNKTEFSELL